MQSLFVFLFVAVSLVHSQMTDAYRQTILDEHNRLRRREVIEAPGGASNMVGS